ncbi:MAG: RluA family pseudouridine synthase [Spirochaetaceae bacterium]|jgi:23S rRNA pseudouridine955/2504/2580 synthase|nr:RluA family pseudouridine synthase [Spirochaetaceae bacterium]
MLFRHLRAETDDHGRRLDRVVRRVLRDKVPNGRPGDTSQPVGLSGAYSAIRKGFVKLNGKTVSPETRVSQGDALEIADFLIPSAVEGAGNPPDPGIPVIFENEHFIILNKPCGVDSQTIAPQNLRPSLSFTPAPLHRLDRRTTGILVCSASLEGACWFSAALRTRRLDKRYLGIAENALPGEVRWDDPVGGKSACTIAVPLSRGTFLGKPVTLGLYKIKTGRKHQIRAQGGIHGFPLLGDVRYGGKKIDAPQGYFLHAFYLGFPQKVGEGGAFFAAPPEIRAPLPSAFAGMLRACGITWTEDWPP